MAFWLIALVFVSIIQAALQYFMRPKVQKRGPGELQAPFAEQGHPIAYIAGCVRKRGVNVVWKGATKTVGKSDDQIFDYYCDMMLAICQGPVDRIRRMWFGQDSIPKVKISYSRGTGFQIHNVLGLTSVVSHVHPPFPTGDQDDVGNQDAHLGAIVCVAPGSNSDWYHPDFLPAAGDGYHPGTGYFAVYQSFTNTSGASPIRAYSWGFIAPVKNDTISKDGTYCRWTGAEWVAESALTMPAKEEWVVSLTSKEQNLKINGKMRWYEGSVDQPADDYITDIARAGSDSAPTYAGLCYAVLLPPDAVKMTIGTGFPPKFPWTKTFPGFYWGESNSIPEISFEIERIPDPLGLDAWAVPSTTAAPSLDNGSNTCQDANPANILFEWLTSPTMGIGVPASDVDVASFRDAGRILFHEGVGQSFDIDQQASFDEIAKEVMMVTDGVLYEDPTTGLWTYRLIREPISTDTAALWQLEGTFYTRTDWPVFDEDDFEGKPEFTRGSWGDVANQIKVQFTDRSEGYAQRVVDVQDIANYQAQGELVTIQNTYNSVFSRDLAIRLAYRDLRTLGYPRARLKDRMNRRGWALRPGDCFVVTRDTLGISNMRFRVISIRYGTLMDGGIEFEAVEDVFGMPDTVYSEPGSGWVDPSTIPPVPPAATRAWELAYDVTRDGPRVGMAALVARGSEETTGAVLWSSNGRDMKRIGPIGYTPTGIISSALVLEERTTSIQIQGVTDLGSLVDQGDAIGGDNLILIDDELIAFDGVGQNVDGSIYLTGCLRGVLDTIPRPHAVAARAWLIRRPPVVQPDKTLNDHAELFAVQGTSPGGETDILSATIQGGMTNSRELRPTVPGKFRVGSATDLPGSLTDRVQVGDLAVAWRTRNRLAQAPGAVAQDTGTIVPEVGQKTRVDLIQGTSRLFPVIGADGLPFPIGKTITIGTANPWATVQGSTWYQANGIGAWSDFHLSNLSGSIYFVGINVATMTMQMVTAKPAAWVELYEVNFVGSGATKNVVLLDRRAKTTLRTADTTAEADTITIADLSGPASSLLPFHEEIRAVDADGKLSMEARETGELFAAGFGMNMGNFMGGN